jgi:hypothetical protein
MLLCATVKPFRVTLVEPVAYPSSVSSRFQLHFLIDTCLALSNEPTRTISRREDAGVKFPHLGLPQEVR